jgi:hypothetical protein
MGEAESPTAEANRLMDESGCLGDAPKWLNAEADCLTRQVLEHHD